MITSLSFFAILTVSFIIYWIVPNKYYLRQTVLIVSSFLFIYLFDPTALIITSVLTIYTYTAGYLIINKSNKAIIHAISVIGLLILLVYFKYIGLLTNTLNSFNTFVNLLPQFEIKNVLLPLGISYIVLKHISYLTDIKWGIVKDSDFIDFLTYSSLFTIFTAGPIERYEKFQPQIQNKELKFEWKYLDEGFQRIVFGLFKKFVIADWIAYFINPIWQNQSEYSIEMRALALLGFSFQIYFDFSGYSDIAIGSSRLFGVKIMENFDYPYLKTNISQFWRSWHISLSDWIRDYVFMPLAKMSNSKVWFYFFVPVIAMGICGIWHGPKWGFLMWGIWHGLGLSGYQIYRKFIKKKKSNFEVYKIFATITTFIFITIGWYWFA
ncbi:MAG: MBOAT family O-acyltransferase [Candidatus Kapaibacterium sp.]